MVLQLHNSSLNLILSFIIIFLVLLVLSNNAAAGGRSDGVKNVKVGVVVSDTEDEAGRGVLAAMEISITSFYEAHPHHKTRLKLMKPLSTKGDIVTAASAALDLIKNDEVEAIIGPEISMEAQFAISLGNEAHVPVITYSATSPFLSLIGSDYFIQATQVDSNQVAAICSLIQSYGWRQVVPIYVDNDFGGGLIPSLIDGLQQIGVRTLYSSVIPSSAARHQIVAELYKLKSMATRVFIVHMHPSLGARLFSIAKKVGMMNQGFAWIITNEIGNRLNTMSSEDMESLRGVIGVKTHVQNTTKLENFTLRWKRKVLRDNENELDPQMTVIYLWASDAIEALARAVEQVGGTSYLKAGHKADEAPTDLSLFGVSQVGEELMQALKGVTFAGLSGDFNLTSGQLEPSDAEIINVNDNGESTMVGVWTLRNGLNMSMNSTIWPGNIKDPPKGWVAPTNENKLRILVPVKAGFNQFVKVENVSGRSTPKVTGYCIDVFDAIMNSLPYPISYEYFPDKANQTQSYDGLIDQVYHQKYDAAVGDIAILVNRSFRVAFTFPYMGSGLTTIVPIKNLDSLKWAFAMPFSLELWLTIFCYFILFAFVIWVLEHPINPHFNGATEYQVGASLYYAFSTMVFAHSHNVFNNLARCVVIIWLLFILVLTQSYTANLTSILTVKEVRPTVTSIEELNRTRMPLGVQTGSFVKAFLTEEKNFSADLIRYYKDVDDLHALFKNGEIAAAMDETPYIKAFLSTHCDEYVVLPQTAKFDGLGFAFVLGSPLLADVSRQLLNVFEGEEMEGLERKWFGQQASCSESRSIMVPPSSELGLDSFYELFIIIGCVSVGALVVFLIMFLYENRRVWLHREPNVSVWKKVKDLARIYNERSARLLDPRNDHNGQSPINISSGDGAATLDQTADPPPPPPLPNRVPL